MKKPILRGRYKEIFLALADAFFPPDGGLSRGGSQLINPDFVSRYFGYAEDDLRLGLKGLLLFWDYGAPIINGKGLKKFRNLSLRERVQILEKMEKSPNDIIRYLLPTTKTLFSMFFYDHPEVWEKVGYREECLK